MADSDTGPVYNFLILHRRWYQVVIKIGRSICGVDRRPTAIRSGTIRMQAVTPWPRSLWIETRQADYVVKQITARRRVMPKSVLLHEHFWKRWHCSARGSAWTRLL